MPYHVAKTGSCPASKPWGCIKTADGKVMGCHPTEDKAKAQMAALYANEPGKQTGRLKMSRNMPWRTARKMYALNQGRNDWYRIRNQINGPTQLHIYDEIGYFGVTAMDLARDLADVSGPLEVHLNSPGGEVFDGIAIYNTLRQRRDVTIVIDGIAASIASVIAMAGSPILVARSGTMMVHDGFGMAIGNAQDMRETADQLDRASNNIASIYSEHTGRPQEYWRQIMKAETWYNGQEAIDVGLADRFLDSGAGRPVVPPEENWDLEVFRGQHKAPPVAPEEPGSGPSIIQVMVPMADGSFEMWDWDAAAAMGKCHSAADFHKIAFEQNNSSSPDSAAHYALPHHSSPGAGPDRGGVIAALGRWNQTQDLKNKEGALTHLKSHARELGLPSGGKDSSPTPVMNEWLEPTDEDVNQFLAALKGE